MFTIGKSKDFFFDREAVIRAMDKATRQALSKGGAFVMTSARTSMKSGGLRARGRVAEGKTRKVTQRTSEPGRPPYYHNRLLKDRIFFAADLTPGSPSVVIGPELIAKSTDAPRVLEFGGTTTVTVGRKGNRQNKTVRIAARPFMAPALAKEAPALPAQFRNSMVRS